MAHLDGTWNLDPSHSEVGFTVRHAGISKVRGQFKNVSATAEFIDGVGRITASAKADSFDSGDENRDEHVKSEDFLNVEEFPTLDFFGTFENNTLRGELTIRGVTQPVEFEVDEVDTAVDPFGLQRAGTEAKTVISRKDFGLTWNAALETGGVLVSDKVTLTIDASFVKDAGETESAES